jgi:hypothetical protein
VKNLTGFPVIGTVSFTSATTTAFTLKLSRNGQTYTPTASECIVITDIVASTNDTAPILVTIDDGASGQTLFTGYMSTTAQLQCTFFMDSCTTRPNTTPRATLGTITGGKAATVTFHGFIQRI